MPASVIICPALGAITVRSARAFLIMAKARKKLPKRVAVPRRAALSAAHAGWELEELNRVGIALSETRDVERLLDLILRKAREITGADAGSLYLAEQNCGNTNGPSRNVANGAEQTRQLRFRLTQNDSVQFPYAE